jgi:hypothetical protein
MVDNSQYSRKKNNSTNYVHPNEQHLWELHKAMGYDPYGYPVLRIDDTTRQHSSLNRAKVSTDTVVFYNASQYDTSSTIWDQQINGTGTVSYDPFSGATTLRTGTTPGDEIIRQTRKVIPYTPGRQNQIIFGAIPTVADPGIRQRLGLFDERNGIYFENDQGVFNCVLRRDTPGGIVETRIPRENFNVDRFDGLGPSGIDVSLALQQTFVIEYEWTGGGQVEFALLINNNKFPAHQFNTTNFLSYPYINSPYLPLRVELTNISASTIGRLDLNSVAVSTEGDRTAFNSELNVATPLAGVRTAGSNVFRPVLSVRLRPDRLSGIVNIKAFQASTLDNTAIYYQVIENTALTGANWTNYSPDSWVQTDFESTDYTGGTILSTGFLSQNNLGGVISLTRGSLNQLGRQTMGTTSEIFTVVIASVAPVKDVFASINWEEIR